MANMKALSQCGLPVVISARAMNDRPSIRPSCWTKPNSTVEPIHNAARFVLLARSLSVRSTASHSPHWNRVAFASPLSAQEPPHPNEDHYSVKSQLFPREVLYESFFRVDEELSGRREQVWNDDHRGTAHDYRLHPHERPPTSRTPITVCVLGNVSPRTTNSSPRGRHLEAPPVDFTGQFSM